MTNIILDCDPGHDDAIAIMLAIMNKDINLLGITTSAGNQTIEKTTKNALNMVQFLKSDVKVYRGTSRAILGDVKTCPEIHGESGLDGYSFPPLRIEEEKMDAVDFIISELLSNKEKTTLVTTGPMTNVAIAIIKESKILKKIDKIVLMGGSIGAGNVSPSSEFNILSDPEAAHICFTSGVPIYMIGLDVTRQVLTTAEVVNRMSLIKNDLSDLFVKLMITYNKNQNKTFGLNSGPMHDPLTIAYLIDNEIISFTKCNVQIDLSHGPSYGRTNCDLSGYLNKEENINVATSVNIDKFWNLIEKSICSFS